MNLPKQEKVHITGMGIISALGKNVKENLDSILDGKSGIRKIQYLDTVHKDKFHVAEVPYTNGELHELAGIPLMDYFPRTTLLASIAVKEALQDSNYSDDTDIRTGLVMGTTVGGMDVAETNYRVEADKPKYWVACQNKSYTADYLAEQFGINDFVTTITTACSSSANAIMIGCELIKNNQLDRVIVGGSDSLCKYTLNGFNTLMILSEEPCTPFDEDRKGLTLGEGAGFLVLESEALVKKYNKKSYAVVSGYSNKNDAFHQTATSENGNGPFLCMSDALEMAELLPKDINYINAHGTGTPNNDLTESIAIERVFGEQYPPFSSLKPFIGHTLGAAGGIEAIFSVLCINKQIIYPSLNFKNPISEVEVKPNDTLKKAKITHVMSNSFGFGGNDTTVILSQS
ncbi:beta-ketoacyl-[acyl-carrier-protein] synthase family protein [Plebeiibacterium sediminum]|uniref:Beta-ketoacyl-[acyl-carrier-protein] synthase family protein n=1 Tax=Plebeiibacterium sediminum TaxID=2992112 RepID=A0AAE3M455_9BACT|nr:beta-ketoacyl-[acyl-carrier-protein] synthase family protein [Plebeiobacterium sediminum]MCW3786779.1 beta-ketoacyl-[acyl-carrier-protein] synthase family protein [Plebeiobacterium sediminum]